MSVEIVHSCPRCRRGGGQPYRAVPGDAADIRILLRCDMCHHRWSTLVAQDALSADVHARLNRQSTWPPE